MAKYVLSPEAQESLKQIKAFSIDRFGQQRTTRYLNEILISFRSLADQTIQGLIREDLMPGYHSYFVGSHTIYYIIKPDLIQIIDVLHQSMEPSHYLLK